MGGMIHSNASGFFGDFIIGDLFGVLNTWMLTFAVLVLMYIVFVGTLSTANDGKAMGEKGHSLWIPVRGAISIAMLAPAHISGYCIAQKLVMFIVLAGVAGANAMWSHAVDKLVSQDVVKALISQQPSFANGKLLVPVEAMFEQQACRSALRKKHGNGDLERQGPYYVYQGRIPNVETDTAFYSIFKKDNKKNDKNAGQKIGSAVMTGWHKAKNTVTGKDPGDEYKPICGGIWWSIPFMKVPIMTKTTVVDAQAATDDQPGSPNGDPVMQNSFTFQENVALQQKIESVVAMMYNELSYAGKYFSDQIDENSDSQNGAIICNTGASSETINANLPGRDSSIGAKYGCFVQAMADYNMLINQTLTNARNNQFGKKAKDYIANPYVLSGGNLERDGDNTADQNSDDYGSGNSYIDPSDPNNPDDQGDPDKKYLNKGINPTHPIALLRQHIINQGWANAGSYFYNIVELSSAGVLSPLQLNVTPMYVVTKKDHKSLQDIQESVQDYLSRSYSSLSRYYNQELNVDNPDPHAVAKAKAQQIRSQINYDFGDEELTGLSRMILDIVTLGMAQVVANWDRSLLSTVLIDRASTSQSVGLVSPIIALQELGKSEIDQVQQIWITGMQVIGGITIGTATLDFFGSSAGTAIGQGVNSMISWLQSIMSPVAMLLYGSGFMLSIWLPFAPYILSIFCVFGWLLSVIEMMVAAPIIALGVLSPEGHDIFGKASPAVMLSLGIFLRPMLMIFGFVVGLVAIYIASNIVNAGFLHMVHSVFHNHLTLLSAIGVITMYTLVMTSLANKSFGLMTQISERVLRWIGGRDATFDQGELTSLKDVEGGVKGAGEAGGKAQEAGSKIDTKGFDTFGRGVAKAAGAPVRALGKFFGSGDN